MPVRGAVMPPVVTNRVRRFAVLVVRGDFARPIPEPTLRDRSGECLRVETASRMEDDVVGVGVSDANSLMVNYSMPEDASFDRGAARP